MWTINKIVFKNVNFYVVFISFQRHSSKKYKESGEEMGTEKQNLQDVFLNHVRKEKVPVTIFLINGVKLQGAVTWYDNFCILLRREGQMQLVYKHAISTIMPNQPINLYADAE